jgi:hypothetical protein
LWWSTEQQLGRKLSAATASNVGQVDASAGPTLVIENTRLKVMAARLGETLDLSRKVFFPAKGNAQARSPSTPYPVLGYLKIARAFFWRSRIASFLRAQM